MKLETVKMKSLISRLVPAAAAAALICIGFVLAGLGIWLVALLAMFALVAAGLGLLASPFVALLQPAETPDQESLDATAAA